MEKFDIWKMSDSFRDVELLNVRAEIFFFVMTLDRIFPVFDSALSWRSDINLLLLRVVRTVNCFDLSLPAKKSAVFWFCINKQHILYCFQNTSDINKSILLLNKLRIHFYCKNYKINNTWPLTVVLSFLNKNKYMSCVCVQMF